MHEGTQLGRIEFAVGAEAGADVESKGADGGDCLGDVVRPQSACQKYGDGYGGGDPAADGPVVHFASPSQELHGQSLIAGIQQQGVRKRRDIDLQELAVSDTRQAIHDVRRISVLLVLVVIALVVLTILLR